MSKTFSPELIMIDVDGTLVDSVPDLSWCLDETLKKVGLPPRGEAAARKWVGNGVIRIVERGIANDLDAPHDEAIFKDAMPIFRELYAENTSKRSKLYPGVREGVDYLKSTGIKIGCITNKDEQFTHPILKDLGLWNDFEIVISGDTLEKKKPDPLPLLHGAKMLGVKPENSLMLGDSTSDVKAARAAGFEIICMSYGYNHGDDIRDSNPDAVIDSMTELRDMIKPR
ncbi:phosphoglycolate phosphatase [Cocleimonas flava]|uniref:Phosphoglycolate phosphatase n=1 Tax=Cocleimonas flava TaxID=634765 RepID=A0A4R1F8T2_9GAMM|nr:MULTISPECIES: phosphoglycolate phosphatase [Cocleimonas]MEB8431990.1 phosphoglycolate phosphatase [Cocleimonas sp. KMM 6892]MEC4714924.1 phosphoglycolate phosphatase [Cocleimonas sp. KMM 6895]MEC4744262.1 phosphoglycolate phosphatase [Cocleimonas sp. KMM 6896]TCJ87151.1 phosphoglycolate phosphatase [Cocleimonas flava]